MGEGILTKDGKLKKRYLPAIYFDSSLVIDYWLVEGWDYPENDIDMLMRINEPRHLQVIRHLLHSETRLSEVARIREKLIPGRVKVSPVISPLSLLELMEWQAEAAFKEIASEASNVRFIQKKSKKELGDYLKKLLKMRSDEVAKEKGRGKESSYSTGLEILMSETWLNRSFADCHGLQGLLQVDLINFNLTVNQAWMEPSAYAYLQLGIADIMHILIAKHLGCSYIASFDDDFKRASDIITEETGIIVLTNPKQILDIL